MSREMESLCDPISVQSPCGDDLEDSQLLASFDGFRLFGQFTSAEEDGGEANGEHLQQRSAPPDWGEIKTKSVAALAQSKDLRILAHLGAAMIRTDGLTAYFDVLSTAARWLESYWDSVYPRIDEDAVLRRNALNCLADRVAVIQAVRKVPLISHPRFGTVSMRDLELASGQAPTATGEVRRPDDAQINAAFTASPIGSLAGLVDGFAGALDSAHRIASSMVSHAGVEAAPALEPLEACLKRAQDLIGKRIKAHPDGERAGAAAKSGNGADKTAGEQSLRPLGTIQSREDAIRALDAIAQFFRQSEPSSPVPLIVERAKRLVSKDFLEVLADVAPDALAQARAAGGIRES
jgi:type VI secretion system protein ImpA